MIPVDEARARLLSGLAPLAPETVPLLNARGRVCAAGVIARHSQPETALSAMDGYAVRAGDLDALPVRLTLRGRIAAGETFEGTLQPGEAVRLFTGAPVPDGADTVVPQEDADASDASVLIRHGGPAGRHIRAAGKDFAKGAAVIDAETRLSPAHLALAAAAGHADLPVIPAPRIGVLATGSELVRPGPDKGPAQTIASSLYGLLAAIETWGGTGIDLGIAPDTDDALDRAIDAARHTDVLVTLGGASVGDHDLVQGALIRAGYALDFWRIAMRPGKPLMVAWRDGRAAIGLPGNPVSTMVCALLFLKPAIARLAGRGAVEKPVPLRLAGPLAANESPRQDYIRARFRPAPDGPLVEAFPVQDSAMLAVFAQSDALIIRPPGAPAAAAGETVPVLVLGQESDWDDVQQISSPSGKTDRASR